MPATQTTYVTNLLPGAPGVVVNMETANSITRLVEDAAGIGFGIATFQGVGDLGITGTPSALFRGVTITDKTLVVLAGQTVDVYAQKAIAGLLVKGVIWVIAAAPTTPGAPAFVTPTGTWSATATGNTAVSNATFDSTAQPGALAKLRLS